MNRSQAGLSLIGAIAITFVAAPAQAGLIIDPIFGSTIANDPNAAAIEGTINSAISTYEATFTDPITVSITFNEMNSGLGQSSFTLYTFSYQTFYNALVADGKTADDATALAHLATDGTGVNNPVTGTNTILIKGANAHALGLNCGGCASDQGGTIGLNTSITDVSGGAYNLLPVVEHEMDEILGLGSTLGLSGLGTFSNDPSPEDFFRFTSTQARTFTINSSTQAFFSIDGTTDLDQFDNQNDGGDFGDWQSNPLPGGIQPQVQDAFATAGSNPALNVELRALDVIGYDRAVSATPEPGTLALLGSALLLAGIVRLRVRKASWNASEEPGTIRAGC